MNSHGITKENLLAALPQALQRDPSVSALAEGIAEVLAERPAEIDRLRIYPAIDRLDERLLDILAQDFKVDWWDPNYSLEEKRRTLRDHWRVHKSLGTPAAVVTAISAIYQGTTLEEWFQYDGEPYHFRLNIDLTGDQGDPERMQRVLERLEYYKSLRSHLDSVDYSSRVGPLPFETEEAVLFLTLMIPLRFPNVPDEIITLDGQRRLDGTWSLDQRVPGIRMPSLEITLTAAGGAGPHRGGRHPPTGQERRAPDMAGVFRPDTGEKRAAGGPFGCDPAYGLPPDIQAQRDVDAGRNVGAGRDVSAERSECKGGNLNGREQCNDHYNSPTGIALQGCQRGGGDDSCHHKGGVWKRRCRQ